MRSYYYQYETSPRKLKPDYSSKRKQQVNNRKSTNKKNNNSKISEKKVLEKQKNNVQKEKKSNKDNANNVKIKFSIFLKCFVIFLVFFLVIYRNSLIAQSFAKIQTLKTSITELQKENNQLEINIQNSININNIEQAAKELLGMQKLTNRQMVYISLSKKDYVEPRTEEIILEEDNLNFVQKVIEKIKNLF